MEISVIDVIFILLLILFVVRCYLKGFVSELFSMAAVVLGLLASLFFYKNGGEYLRSRFWPELKLIPEVIAFISLFLIVFIVIKLLEIMLKGIINGVKLTGADRFLGIFFGMAEGIVVISLVVFVLRIQPLFDPSSILSESVFARLLLPLITGQENTTNV
ncbi:MAG: CvpA family protein [Treponema sp.]|nr:CvpA family protein [Treponema sp.]